MLCRALTVLLGCSGDLVRVSLGTIQLRYFASDRDEAILRFARFVAEGVGVNIWEHLKQQIYLGDNNFINKQLAYKPKGKAALSEVPHKQRRRTAPPLSHFLASANHRDEAIISAYQSGGYSLTEIADYVGLHYTTVSRIVRKSAADSA